MLSIRDLHLELSELHSDTFQYDKMQRVPCLLIQRQSETVSNMERLSLQKTVEPYPTARSEASQRQDRRMGVMPTGRPREDERLRVWK